MDKLTAAGDVEHIASQIRLRVSSGILAPTVVVIFILAVALFNTEITSRLYLNHIAQLALVVIAAAVWWRARPSLRMIATTTSVVAVSVVAYLLLQVVRSLAAPEFPNVFLKLLFVVSTLASLVVLDPTGRFQRDYLAAFVTGTLGVCVLGVVNSDPMALALGVRFSVEYLGIYGFNTLGFVLAIAVTFAVYLSAESDGPLKAILWLLPSIALLCFLIMTNSRGPAVSVAVALTVYLVLLGSANLRRASIIATTLIAATLLLSQSMPTLLTSYAALRAGHTPTATPSVPVTVTSTPSARTPVPASTPYLERFDVSRDPTLSGRTALWAKLMSDLAGRPDAMLVGFGLGTIDWQTDTAHFRSAHNTYLEVLYFTGAIGLAAVGLLLVATARKIPRLAKHRQRLAWPVLALLLVSMMIDSYWGASQLGWVQSVMIYLIVAAPSTPSSTAVD